MSAAIDNNAVLITALVAANIEVYTIGDTGPAGGIVFYTSNGGLNGLEAALEDQDDGTGARWGYYGTDILGPNGTAIGTGIINTSWIVAENWAGSAAGLASNYTLNGYDNWFLPSKDELNALYEAQHLVGGFASDSYWSSSESSASFAWIQDFTNGYQSSYCKDCTRRVRAVRAF